jgi:transcriptional regulator with XRE-family HTH domain
MILKNSTFKLDKEKDNVVDEVLRFTGLRNNEIAEKVGVTPSTITKWRNGEIKLRTTNLIKLSESIDSINPHLIQGEIIDEIIPDTPVKMYHRLSQFNQTILLTYWDLLVSFKPEWFKIIHMFNQLPSDSRRLYLNGLRKAAVRMDGCETNESAVEVFCGVFVSLVGALRFRKDIQWSNELTSSTSTGYERYKSIKESFERFHVFSDKANELILEEDGKKDTEFLMTLLKVIEYLNNDTLDFIYYLTLSQFDRSVYNSILKDWL